MRVDLDELFARYGQYEEECRRSDEELLDEPEEEICPVCGGLMFECEDDSFTLHCPECEAVPTR